METKWAKYLFLSLLMVCKIVCAQNLHMIIVFDSNEPNIGRGNSANSQLIFSEAEKVVAKTGLNLVCYSLSGSNFKDYIVQNTINALNCQSNDVIWFYYAGHGTNSGGKWPKLLIHGSGLFLENIHNQLCKKGARFCISMADCCNFSYNSTTPRYYRRDSILENRVKENYIKLFMENKGDIIASGCIPGQFSKINNEMGGIFTNSFIEVMYNNSKKEEEITWTNLFEKTKLLTIESARAVYQQQEPQYEVWVYPSSISTLASYVSPTNDNTIHYVIENETMTNIANHYGTTITEITQINNITDANHLLPGQTLIIPNNTILNNNFRIHRVAASETFYSIALKYGIPVPLLHRANPQIPNINFIREGQELRIPIIEGQGMPIH